MLDEPSSGLDLKNSKKLWKGIKGVMTESSCAVLLTTHLGEEAEVLCDDVVVLSRGVVVSNSGGVADVDSYEKTEVNVVVFVRKEAAGEVVRSLSDLYGDREVTIEGGKLSFTVLARDALKTMKRLREFSEEIVWRVGGGAKSIDEMIGES